MWAARVVTGVLLSAWMCASAIASAPERWNAWLECPGGKLPFALDLDIDGASPRAWITNGSERIEVPHVRTDDGALVFEFVHYQSAIRAEWINNRTLRGTWRKRQGADDWTEMPFHARRARPQMVGQYPVIDKSRVNGRWSVQFSSSDDLAVGEFRTNVFDLTVEGTFLTTVGDFRFLGGDFDGETLTMSVFDGAHAFLFRAKVQPDGTLSGDFWSRDTWHETWTARKNEEASLPDAFGLTAWTGAASLDDLTFRDMAGEPVSPADQRYAGKARIIEVFGTWCPNCNDATQFLIELDERYRERGLSILGLAFEMTGDHEIDTAQIQRYIDYHGIDYSILYCGIHNKPEASKLLPVLDRVRSYPTFIFLDSADRVRAIYTGFSGPATGARYDKLREDFTRIIEELLEEEPPGTH